jgi:hypothetical protein
MKKIIIKSVLLILISLLQFSCNSDGITNSLPTTNPVDVYVAGSKNGQACYWKNGQIVMLDSGGFDDVSSYKIIVSNNDVHVIGYGTMNSQPNILKNLYWKNGVLTNLNASFSTSSQIVWSIDDMEVIGNDVYFIGYMQPALLTLAIYDLVYWKNGIKTIVKGNINGYSSAQIAILNSDIYVTFSANFNLLLSGYYKNNDFTALPNAQIIGLTKINSQIVVFGSQLMSGFYYNTTTNVNTVVPFANDSNIKKMCFENNNLYYSNYTDIFKNGTLFDNVTSPETLTSFNILNNNLYKITNISGITSTHKLMINDVTIMTTTTLNETYDSLFIVQN